jgi:hypothetical protein
LWIIFALQPELRIRDYFIFEMLKKKIWPNFPRNIEVFTQKIDTKPSKIWVRDPRSGIRKKPIPDPGSRVKKAPDPGSGSATQPPGSGSNPGLDLDPQQKN